MKTNYIEKKFQELLTIRNRLLESYGHDFKATGELAAYAALTIAMIEVSRHQHELAPRA
jgi:hypothetical protein